MPRNSKFTETDNSTYETREYIREFSGRMTKLRWKIIDSWARRKTWRQSCSCQYDCCGCIFEETMKVTYAFNQVTIIFRQHHNY